IAAKTSAAPAAPTPVIAADAATPHPAAPTPAAPPPAGPAPNTTTVTIIDGKTGARQEVVVPAPANATPPNTAAAAVTTPGALSATSAGGAPPADQKFTEASPHGPIPKIAVDGTRPADAFARPVQPLPGKPDAPRIALIVTGLGIGTNATTDAIAKLPGPVTLALVPYGADIAALATRARTSGHEVLLQVPMEPFEYPDNDPGPQTLLTSLTPPQN